MTVAGSMPRGGAGTPGAPLLRIRGVTKTFDGRPPVDALSPIDLDLAENEFVSLVGTSGCGKSTLLGIVAGLVEPTDWRGRSWTGTRSRARVATGAWCSRRTPCSRG